jgi:tripartite-type tricarboxylate transporter receptor subunit TctC
MQENSFCETRRRCLAWVAAPLAANPAVAQDFPTKPVRLILTTAPGGIADTIYRAAAEPMARFLRQPVVVESKPGGSGAIATTFVAKAPPDGHTLVMTSDTTLVLLPLLRRNLPYAPDADLALLGALATVPFGLVVPAALPVKNLREFTAYVKSRPGRLNYASIGAGSSYHLAAEMFLAQAMLDMVHVPYQGGSQILTSLIRNDTSAAFSGVATFIEQVKGGSLKILAVSGEHRLSVLPDVPTFREAGLPDYRARSHVGLAVPQATPAAVQRHLFEALHSALDDTAYRRTVVEHGMVIADKLPQQTYVDELARERGRWATLIAKRHISLD